MRLTWGYLQGTFALSIINKLKIKNMKKIITKLKNNLGFITISVMFSIFTFQFASQTANAQAVHQLWGMTYHGIDNNNVDGGGMFKINFDGSNFGNPLFFNSPALFPWSHMIQLNDGKLYGTTSNAYDDLYGPGVIFSYDPDNGTYTNVHLFDSLHGSNPNGAPMLASNGLIYGLTSFGGAHTCGVLYSFDPVSHAFTDLFDFRSDQGYFNNTGSNPNGNLIQANDGLLYGLCPYGGQDTGGVIFSFNINTNAYQIVHHISYGKEGFEAYGSLIQASDGKLYGTTFSGGNNPIIYGTVFSFDIGTGIYTVIHKFVSTDGRNPYCALVQTGDGKLYGTANGGPFDYNDDHGLIFSIDIFNNNTYTDEHNFDWYDGADPYGGLMVGSDGKLYGVTSSGYPDGSGAIYSFDVGAHTFSDLYFLNSTNGSGSFGELVEVLGTLNTITTNAVLTTLCSSTNLSVSFTATGTYLNGNVFTAQLSDASGSFSSPTAIGTLSGTTSGTINSTIPQNANGTGYRIRVIASNPNAIGSDNGADISIHASPTANISYPFSAYCSTAGIANVNFTGTGVGGTYSSSNLSVDPNSGDVNMSASTSGTVTYSYTDGNGCSVVATTNIQIITLTANYVAQQFLCSANSEIDLVGTVSNGTFPHWTTSGDGFFDNAWIANPNYIPGNQDYSNGSVELNLNISEITGACAAIDYPITVSMVTSPTASISYSQTFYCAEQDSAHVIFVGTGTGGTYTSIGIPVNPVSGSFDLSSQGSASIFYNFTDGNGCHVFSEADEFVNSVFASAGPDITICYNDIVQINGSGSSSPYTLHWVTSGDGTFDFPDIAQPFYHPGQNDIQNGVVQLTIFADDPSGTCPGFVSYMFLYIHTLNENAGNAYITICHNQSAELNGTISSFATAQWTTNGDGIFDDPTSASTFYNPGPNDISNTFVQLTLTATDPGGLCTPLNSIVILTIENQDPPTASISYDYNPYCADGSFISVDFSGTGTGGTFSESTGLLGLDPSTGGVYLDPYYPGNYTVNYFYSTENGCSVSASADISISSLIVNLFNNQPICESQVAYMSGQASFGASTLWTTNGDGYFDAPDFTFSIYYPGPNDIANGSVVITLSAHDNSGVCPDASQSELLIINPQPTAEISYPESPYCSGSGGAEVTFSGTIGGFYSYYAIDFFNHLELNPSNGTINLELSDQGDYVVYYQIFNEGGCGVFAYTNITISLLTADGGGDQAICSTDGAILSGTVSNGATALWITEGDGAFLDIEDPSTIYYPGPNDIANGIVILGLSAHDESGVCSDTYNFIYLSIYKTYADAGSNQTICEDVNSINLNGNVSFNTTSIWTTNGDGVFGDASSPVTTYTPGLGDRSFGIVHLTLTDHDNSGTCQDYVNSMTLYINLDPIVNSGIYSFVCVNSGLITLYGNPLGGTFSGTGVNGNTFDPTVGTQTITYTYSTGGCTGSSTSLISVGQLPDPAGPITGNTTICHGSTNTYSIAPVAGANFYIWTLPSGWTGNSNTTSISIVAGNSSGTISVTANDFCGSSGASALAVTVNTGVPSQPGAISGPASACHGSSQTYSIAPVSGATSYIWTLPSGWTGTSNSTSINVTLSTNSGNVTVKAVNSCGNGTIRTLGVSSIPNPAQPGVITGNSPVCANSSQTYSISPVSGATSYTWTLPSGWSGTSITTSITVTAGNSGGNIVVKANNVCGSSTNRTLAITVTNVPVLPGVITGSTTVCSGTTQTYSIVAMNGVSGYTWTLPSGWSGSSVTNSITVTTGSGSGSISVAAINGCGTGSARSLSITVNQIPAQPGSITGNTTVCNGTSQSYSVVAIPGATSYTWTLPSGWTGTSATRTISTVAGASGGTISVTANNACGNSNAQTISITVNSIPAQPGTISGNASVCKSSTQTYSISPVAGATSYIWTLPSGWTGTSITTSMTCTIGTVSGNVSVKASNGCGNSPVQTLAVTVNTITAVSITSSPSNNNFCAQVSPTSVTMTASAGYTSYSWSPGGANTQVVTVNEVNTYFVTATNAAGCTTMASKNVTSNCALPTSLSTSNILGTSAKANWVQSQCRYNYIIQISVHGMNNWTQHVINPSTTYTFTGLSLSTQYDWQIQTNCNTSGSINSGWSAIQTFTTAAQRMAEDGNAILPFNIYPNPAQSMVTVAFSSMDEGNYNLKLIDMMGRVVKSENDNARVGENTQIFSLDGIAKGIYMVIVQKGEMFTKVKLVVE